MASVTPDTNAVQLTFPTTGTVQIRPSMRSQPPSGYTLLRRLRSVCDRRWTETIPVGVFLIRHPVGLFLFDTGQSPCCNDRGYSPRTAISGGLLAQFTIERGDGILDYCIGRGLKRQI
ncbi:hypothetical protein BDW62DRAFT_205911 [Aspergillus aurantiobrunneus]